MQINGIGSLPEYGAIFMSNSATKKECLRRKLFGLSPKHGHFVKQIKAGMILFLFEFEKRQLYGVFEACSDGGINIIPHAFSTFGKKYPAQVKVKSIWICDPLSEPEFRDAIVENYFSAKKFNFGLSKVQVLRLLQLFSSKKLGVPRRLTKSSNSKLIVDSMDGGRQVDDCRSKVHGGINDEYVSGFNNMDMELIPATTTGHPRTDKLQTVHSMYNFGDIPSDGGLLSNNERNNGFENISAATAEYSRLDKVERHDNNYSISGWGRSEYCPNTAISTQYSEPHSGDVERIPSDCEFLRKDEFQNENDKDYGFEPSVPSEYSSLHQSIVSRSVLSRKPPEIRNSVTDQTTTHPSHIHHQMQSPLLSDLYSKASYRDAVVTSTHSNNSIAPSPSLNYPHPLADEFNPHSEAKEYQPFCGCPGIAISSSRKPPFSSHQEQIGVTEFREKISTHGCKASFSGSTPSENLHHETTMGLPQTSYCKNLDLDLEKDHCYSGHSPSKYSLADTASMRTRIKTRENKFTSWHPLSTSMYPILDAYSHQVEPEYLQLEAAQKNTRESFMGDIASAYEDPFTLQDCLSSVAQKNTRESFTGDIASAYEEDPFTLLKYDSEHYQSNDTLFTGPCKNRASVFSRLSVARDAYVPEHNGPVGYEDNDTSTSVDEIMEMLHKNHHQWVESKRPKQDKRQDDAEKFARRKETTAFHEGIAPGSKRWVNSKQMEFHLAKTNWKVDLSLGGTEQATQLPEKSFLNFKRRSEMQKLLDGGMTAVSDANSRNDSVSGGSRKKRKLIRPNFGKSDLCDGKDAKNCSSTLQAQAEEIPIAKDNTGHCCEASIRKQDDKHTSFFEFSNEAHLIRRRMEGDVVFDSERREARQGSCTECHVIGVEFGKWSATDNVEVQSSAVLSTLDGKNPDVLKDKCCSDSTVDGLPNASNIISDPIALESFSGAETRDEVETNECQIVELLPTAHGANESCVDDAHRAMIDQINNSLDRFYEMLKKGVGKEH